MFKNTYFEKHLLTAASENTRKQILLKNEQTKSEFTLKISSRGV